MGVPRLRRQAQPQGLPDEDRAANLARQFTDPALLLSESVPETALSCALVRVWPTAGLEEGVPRQQAGNPSLVHALRLLGP